MLVAQDDELVRSELQASLKLGDYPVQTLAVPA